MPLSGLRFLAPDAATWLLALPLFWTCWVLHRWYRDRRRCASGIGFHHARLSPLSGAKRDVTILALLTVSGLALVCAAARPQAIVRIQQYESFDLIVMLDRSASMLATDIEPSRLSRACLETQTFLRNKPETVDRVALIAFADTAIVMSHLTRDRDVLFFFLEWMKQDHARYYGTDFATAMESALQIAKTDTAQRRKVVVLLSDGEDHGERLERAIDDFRKTRIPIYAVGIGDDATVTLPPPPEEDSPRYATIDDGGFGSYLVPVDEPDVVLTTTFHEATLRRIATVTNGTYFRSTSGFELATTLADVTSRETRPTHVREQYRDIDGFALAVAALTLSALLVLL